jgi:hypothetical protein
MCPLGTTLLLGPPPIFHLLAKRFVFMVSGPKAGNKIHTVSKQRAKGLRKKQNCAENGVYSERPTFHTHAKKGDYYFREEIIHVEYDVVWHIDQKAQMSIKGHCITKYIEVHFLK